MATSGNSPLAQYNEREARGWRPGGVFDFVASVFSFFRFVFFFEEGVSFVSRSFTND